ncbi:LOW QUALITY PROTEIN: protein BFR2-like [Vigna angularis]|uniref:LOW QUALITY PROTEIN: protein BFR2-like n=1 Tax=Phaseolus angularis TaxID=3914 RepID=UPI0022B56381|nr:LOW QUALITY PROTEIN: protein BFR2-like [Vigna angularis]
MPCSRRALHVGAAAPSNETGWRRSISPTRPSTVNGGTPVEHDFDDDGEEDDFDVDSGEEEDGQKLTDDEDDGTREHSEWNNDEMEQLEKEYRHLHHQELDTLKNLKHHKDEDLLKGQAEKPKGPLIQSSRA